ncbi:MAG: YraN family protein [Pigmentiphaga sp.]|nr:YraN family protein [Pigmentiphaga sp.]
MRFTDDAQAAALAARAQRARRRRRAAKPVAILRESVEPVSETQRRGARAESRALAMLEAEGLRLVARNVGSALGEIDLIMREGPRLVFVEVRSRSSATARHGGALASVNAAKQRRLARTAALYLTVSLGRRGPWPACRFDVVAVEGATMAWVRGAFDAVPG